MNVGTWLAAVAAAAAGAVVAVGTPATAVAEPAVEVLSVNGSGCPSDTASAVADDSGFRIAYDRFVARAGTGAAPTEMRRNCQAVVLVRARAGYAFVVARATYRGTAGLPAGAVALRRTNYYLQGSPDTTVAADKIAGPHAGAWTNEDTPALAGPCGADEVLNVNAELRVSSPGTAASISMTGSDVRLDWTSCP
jgi:hypothetical protein